MIGASRSIEILSACYVEHNNVFVLRQVQPEQDGRSVFARPSVLQNLQGNRYVCRVFDGLQLG